MAALDFPDNPATGDLYGSSGTVWRWDGARWASTAGASGARGLVAYSKIVASQGGISGLTDVVGLVCTWVADPARRYRLVFETQAVANPAAMINCYITTAGGTAVQWRSHFLASNGVASQYMSTSVVLSGLSGTQTYKVQVSAAPSAVQITAGPTNPAEFYVEDITYEGGSTNPGGGVPPPPIHTSTDVQMVTPGTAVPPGNYSLTPLNTPVTPRSNNSKFLITVSLMVSHAGADDVYFYILRNGAYIGTPSVGGANGIRYHRFTAANTLEMAHIHYQYLDAPNTLSVVNYIPAVAMRLASQAVYFNRRGDASGNTLGGRSSITVEEIL